jgi:hypothetical protein
MQQAEIIQNHENDHVRGIKEGEARQKMLRGLNMGVVKLTTAQVN